jgi:hypothetical protein
VDVLPFCGFRCEELPEGRVVLCVRLLPVFLDRVPPSAQTCFVRIAILRNDRGDSVGLSEREPETYRGAVIEDIDCKSV